MRAAKGYVAAGGEARFLTRIIRYFGADKMVEDITKADIEEAGEALYPKGATDTRRRQVRVPINAVVNWATDNRRQPSTDKRRVRWLTPEEAEKLLKAAANLTLPRHSIPERYTVQKIAALLGTGMRTGECFAAEAIDFNQSTAQLWLPGIEDGSGKTVSSARWVEFPERAIKVMGDLPEEGRLFKTPYGKDIVLRKNGGGQMAASFKKAVVAAELETKGPRKVTPHTLRHTWATWFYAQTRDFGRLQDLGGWEKADTANRYRKLAPADLSERLFKHGWDFTVEGPTPQKLRAV